METLFKSAEKAPIQRLRTQLIREVLSFLEYRDFVNFTFTCNDFAKFAQDPYIQIQLPVRLTSYALDGKNNPKEDMFINQYINNRAYPALFRTGDPNLVNIFHRDFYDGQILLYSYLGDAVVTFNLVGWTEEPIRKECWVFGENITQAVGHESFVLLGLRTELILICRNERPEFVYDGHLEVYIKKYHFNKEIRITRLGILYSGNNSVCVLNDSEVMIFNYQLNLVCHFLTDVKVTAFNIPTATGRIYILGDARGGVSVYKTYQSKKQAIEVIPHTDRLTASIKKIRATRVLKDERYFDCVISLTIHSRLYANDKPYPENIYNFELKDDVLFTTTGYKVDLISLKSLPHFQVYRTLKMSNFTCFSPLSNKFLTVLHNCYSIRGYAHGEVIHSASLHFTSITRVLHYSDLMIITGTQDSGPSTEFLFYYRPIPT